MKTSEEVRTTKRSNQQRWFGVWGVSNYYHKLEIQARTGAEYNLGYVLLIITAGILATGGLLSNNVAVIIGSMCVAPFLGPSRAVCIGGLYLDKRVFWNGLVKQLFGLFIVGVGLAYLITSLLINTVPGIEITHEILLRAMHTTKDAVLTLIIAVAAGAGASLAFIADPYVVDHPWGQLLDVMIGVEIAISLIPPASVIGIGFAFGDLTVAWNAAKLLIVNILALDVLGSMSIFLLRGIRKEYFNLENALRQIVEQSLEEISEVVYNNSIIDITLQSKNQAQVLLTLRGYDHQISSDLAQTLNREIWLRTECRSDVIIEFSPCQIYSTE